MSSFNLRSKWANFKGHVPSHFGVAAVIGACALLIVACGFIAIGLLSTFMGYPLHITWPGGQLVTNPVPAAPTQTKPLNIANLEQPKTWSERQKDIVWPEQALPKGDLLAKTATAGSQVEVSSQEKSPPKTSLKHRARRDWGAFQLEIPVQGDYDRDDTHSTKHSYVRDGVRFHLHTIQCDPLFLMPYVCYLPKGQPRPVVRGW
jgi:hypothetical protein